MIANAFTEDMEKSKEAGMDEHLSEPVDIAVLERAVRKYLVIPPQKKMRDRHSVNAKLCRRSGCRMD